MFVFVEGQLPGAASTAPRVRNFSERTELSDFRSRVVDALPIARLDILDSWLTPQYIGITRLRCSVEVAAALSANRFDLGPLGLWSLQPRGPKPGDPAGHDYVGQFSINPEFLMEARAGSTGAEGSDATPPRPRTGRGSAVFVERRTAFMREFQRELLSLGVAVLTLPFLSGQEAQVEGPFFPLAGAVEMPYVRAAVRALPPGCPTFAHVTLQQTLAAASAVAPLGAVHPLQLQAHMPFGDKKAFPIDPRSFVDQIMKDLAAVALNPVCFGDRSQIGAAIDVSPWATQSMVLSMPGLEPDGCQALAALDKIAFKTPAGAVVKLAWGAAISDSSGLRRRLNRWWEDGRKTNGGRQRAAEDSAGFATPVRGLFLDAAGETQKRLRHEFGQAGLVDFDGSIRRRTGGQGTLSFAPTTPPREGNAASFSFGGTQGGTQGASRKSARRKRGSRRGVSSSDGSASGGDSAGSRPRRNRRLAGDFAQGGAAGAGGQGEDEIVLDLCMSEDTIALLPPGSLLPPTSKLAVSRGQASAVSGMALMVNNCVAMLLTAQQTALRESEDRQSAALAAAVHDLKVHTDKRIEAETAPIRLAVSLDEEAARLHAAKMQGLREEELAAAEAARDRARASSVADVESETVVSAARERAKARAARQLVDEEAADAEAREHASLLRAARQAEIARLTRRSRSASGTPRKPRRRIPDQADSLEREALGEEREALGEGRGGSASGSEGGCSEGSRAARFAARAARQEEVTPSE